jgi:predicted RNase H-like nuclease (RuvC/YqgF family)
MTQIESQLELLRSQNQIEYESVQNERINQLNQTIDNLQKQNFDLSSSIENMRQYSDEVQSSSAKQLDEMQRNFNNEQLELNQRLSEALNNIESLRSDKQRYEYAYYDLENRYQQIEQLLKDKDMELSINSCFVS